MTNAYTHPKEMTKFCEIFFFDSFEFVCLILTSKKFSLCEREIVGPK